MTVTIFTAAPPRGEYPGGSLVCAVRRPGQAVHAGNDAAAIAPLDVEAGRWAAAHGLLKRVGESRADLVAPEPPTGIEPAAGITGPAGHSSRFAVTLIVT